MDLPRVVLGSLPFCVCLYPLASWCFYVVVFVFCPELIIIIDKGTRLIQIILSSLESRSASE